MERPLRGAAPLVRPSELARHLAVHPKTVLEWIKGGRLPAIRTPGNQFRLSAEDVRAFCLREGLAVPSFAAATSRTILFVGPEAPITLRGARYRGVAVVEAPSLYHALARCLAEPPFALLIAGIPRDLHDFADALRAAGAGQEPVPMYLYDAPSRRRGVLPVGVVGAFGAEERAELGKALRGSLRDGR